MHQHLRLTHATVIFVLLSAGYALGQAEQNQKTKPPTTMQSSIEKQMAAIEEFKTLTSDNSLKQQRASLRMQYEGIAGADQPTSSPFFTNPWPLGEPLITPHILMPGLDCDPLPKKEVQDLINSASKRHGVDSTLLRNVIRHESGFRPCAVSTAGAMGLMQLMPATADHFGVTDPFDAAQSVEAGTRYLKELIDKYQGNLRLALAAYNAGPARVDREGGVPDIPETVAYVSKVLGGFVLPY